MDSGQSMLIRFNPASRWSWPTAATAISTPEQHKLGGYETWLGTNKVEEQASVKIVATLLEMFDELK